MSCDFVVKNIAFYINLHDKEYSNPNNIYENLIFFQIEFDKVDDDKPFLKYDWKKKSVTHKIFFYGKQN